MDEYEKRDEILRELGYPTYKSYLRSRLWKTIREDVRRRSGGQCECCKSRHAAQVHHKSYSRSVMLGETPDELIDLCGRCHIRIEFIFAEQQRKRRFPKVQKMLNKMLKPKVVIMVAGRCSRCGLEGPINSQAWKNKKRPKCQSCGGLVYLANPEEAYR